jgi:hypothetical protein
VVLDTLGAVLEVANNKNLYRAEYREAIKLQKLAQEHGICYLALHHTNKSDSTDAIRRASGTHGLTGAMDSVLLLTSDRLTARPRDGEESEHSLIRLSNGAWKIGDSQLVAPTYSLNPQRQAVMDALANGPKDKEALAKELGLTDEAMRKRLERMERKGQVKKLQEGLYERTDAGQPVSDLSTLSDCPNCPQLGS